MMLKPIGMYTAGLFGFAGKNRNKQTSDPNFAYSSERSRGRNNLYSKYHSLCFEPPRRAPSRMLRIKVGPSFSRKESGVARHEKGAGIRQTVRAENRINFLLDRLKMKIHFGLVPIL